MNQLLTLKVKRFKGLEDNSCGEVDFYIKGIAFAFVNIKILKI